MATKNTRDVELNISATTSGTEQLQQLSKQLRSIGETAGHAAPEFEQLAAQVDKLAEQSTALRKFEEVSAAVNETGDALSKAKARVEELGNELQQKKAAFDTFSQGQKEAKAALAATETALREAKAELNTFKANADQASRATIGYKDTLRDLRTNVAQLENTLAEQKGLVAKKSEVNALESEIRKLSTAYDRAKASVDKIEGSLSKQNAAVDEARTSLNDLGVAATKVSDAQEKLLSNSNEINASIKSQAAAYEKTRLAALELERAQQLLNAELQLEQDIAKGAIEYQEKLAAASRAVAAAKEREATAVAEAAAKLRTQADAAQKALNDAFSATGVRSAETIRAEIARINDSLRVLATNSKVSGAEFDRAFTSAKERVAALERELKGLPANLKEASALTASLRQGFSQLTAAYGAFEIGRGFINSINQMETLRRSLTLITGSTETAAQQIQFLQSVSDRAGLSYSALAQDFINFSAAAQTSGIALETQREVFGAVANAAGQLGISTDRVGLILQAFAQTASKGKVSLEELQGQLGESLPGALSIVANGLGVTKAQLLELVKSGIDVNTFFEAFVKGSKQAFGGGSKEVESFSAALNRLKNQAAELAVSISDSGVGTGLMGAIKGFGVALGTIGLGANTVLESVFTVVKQIAVGVAAIVTRDFKNLGGEMERIAEESLARQTRVAEAYRAMTGLADESGKAQADSAKTTIAAQTGVAQAAETAAVSFQTSTTAQLAAAGAAQSNATAQTNVAGATAAAGNAAATATGSWAQLQIAYQNALKEAENQVAIAEKLVQAKQIEGKSREQIIKLTGDEAAQLTVAAQAQAQETVALDNLAAARQNEVSLLTQQRDRLLAETAARGDASGARQKEIDELNRSIAAKTAEVEKSVQAADASRIEQQARELAVKTYRDNSAAVDELRKSYEQSQQALAAVTRAQQLGQATTEQVTEATMRAAQAEALYRDAIKDVATATDLKVRKAQSTLSITEAQLTLQRAQLQNEIALAQQLGQGALVLDRQIKLKELDLKMSEAKISSIRAEIAALNAQIGAEEAALKSNDPLLEQKRAEIALRRENLKLKEIEIQRLQEEQRGIKQSIDNLRIYGNEAGAAGQNSRKLGEEMKGAGEAGSDALGKAANSADRLAGSLREAGAQATSLRSQMDKEGFSVNQQTGQRVAAEMPTWLSSFNQLKSYGLNDQQAAKIVNRGADSNGKLIWANNPLQQATGASTWSEALRIEAEKIIRTKSQYAPRAEGTSGGGSSHTVNINLGGRSTQINTASAADASALAGLLKQLENESSRSN